jgi:hypothetical protein
MHEVQDSLKKLQHWLRLSNAAADDDAGVLRSEQVLRDLIAGQILVQANETSVNRNAGRVEPCFAVGDRRGDDRGVNAEVRYSVRVNADD